MLRKILIAIMSAVMMVCSILCGVNQKQIAAAEYDETVYITVEPAYGMAGSSVPVTIDIRTECVVSLMNFRLLYDSALTPVPADPADPGVPKAESDLRFSSEACPRDNLNIVSRPAESAYVFSYTSSFRQGKITVWLDVPADAATGTQYPLDLKVKLLYMNLYGMAEPVPSVLKGSVLTVTDQPAVTTTAAPVKAAFDITEDKLNLIEGENGSETYWDSYWGEYFPIAYTASENLDYIEWFSDNSRIYVSPIAGIRLGFGPDIPYLEGTITGTAHFLDGTVLKDTISVYAPNTHEYLDPGEYGIGDVVVVELITVTTTTSTTPATTITTTTTSTTPATTTTTTTTSTTPAITTTTTTTSTTPPATTTTTTTSTTPATTITTTTVTTTSTTKPTTTTVTTTSTTKPTTTSVTTTSTTNLTTTTTTTTTSTTKPTTTSTTTTSTTKLTTATTTMTSTTKPTTTTTATTSTTKPTTTIVTTTSTTKPTTTTGTTTSTTKPTTTTTTTTSTTNLTTTITTTTSTTKTTTTTTTTSTMKPTEATATTTSTTKLTTTTTTMTTITTTTVSTTSTTVTSSSDSAESSETTTLTGETTPTEPEYLIGDINDDGVIGVEDAQLALLAYVQTMAGLESGLTEQQAKAADINGDKTVSVEDAQIILIYYVSNTLSGQNVTWDELLGKKTQALPRLLRKMNIPLNLK